MSIQQQPYLRRISEALQQALDPLLATSVSPSKNSIPIRPTVELGNGPVDKMTIRHSDKEHCYLESSANSVRLSLCLKHHHQHQQKQQQSEALLLEQVILTKYMHYYQQRASVNQYALVRRRPLEGYALSLLVVPKHVRMYGTEAIIKLVLNLLSNVDREVSDVKLSLNARARLVASEFLESF